MTAYEEKTIFYIVYSGGRGLVDGGSGGNANDDGDG